MKRIVLVHAISENGMNIQHITHYIKWMKLLGFKFVSLNQLADEKMQGKLLALVVDDAYKCVKTNLMPILLQYNIPSTLFVPTGLLGMKANEPALLEHACYKNEDMMSVDDLMEWSSKGFEVGFHTDKHIDLSVTDLETQKADFLEGVSKMSKMGYKPDKFAYPFGRLPKNYAAFQELLLANGFRYAYTLWPGNVNNHDPFLINRICLGNHVPLWWNIMKSVGILDRRLKSKSEIAQNPQKSK